MQIETVKQTKSGYLLNETSSVPNDQNNSDYQAIQKWIAQGGIVEPFDFLKALRLEKIAEIENIRDQKNIETIVDNQAFQIDENGDLTSTESYFVFYTARHPSNPASDPSGILTAALLFNQTIPYSTKTPNGEKIVAAITPELARSIALHIADRNNGNYKLCDAIKLAIKKAVSIEEIKDITWNSKYLEK